jgi:hypothetical protein
VTRLNLGLALLGALVALAPASAIATHGGAGLPAVVESERLAAGASGSAAAPCRVAGVVQNPSLSETVTVRLGWQAVGATGAVVATASARVPWLRPGERRAFTSSPFVATTGQTLPSCDGIAHLVRLDATAEPVPVP